MDMLDSMQTLQAFELELLSWTRDWPQVAGHVEAVVGGPWVSGSDVDVHDETGWLARRLVIVYAHG